MQSKDLMPQAFSTNGSGCFNHKAGSIERTPFQVYLTKRGKGGPSTTFSSAFADENFAQDDNSRNDTANVATDPRYFGTSKR
jgi:hypothetical protein